jgi:RecB family exonuclease
MAHVERPVAVAAAGSMPSAISPTVMRDWQQCELKYYFSHVERWRPPASELAEAEANEQYAHLVADETPWADVRSRATSSLDGLFALEDPPRVEAGPVDLSRSVEASLFGAPMRGKIDRLTSAATWTVTDYKTGKVPPPRYVASALSAVYTYAAALAAAHPRKRIPDQVELLYLLGPERIARPVVRGHLLDHARSVGRTWSDVNAAYAAATYTARTGPLCGWCPFAAACPVQSAEAPTPGSDASHDLLSNAGLAFGRERAERDDDPLADAAEAAQPMEAHP